MLPSVRRMLLPSTGVACSLLARSAVALAVQHATASPRVSAATMLPTCAAPRGRGTAVPPVQTTMMPSSFFSSDAETHPDFAPQRKGSDVDVTDIIKQQISENRIFLYMKGTPEAPQCGFSQMVCMILEAMEVDDFASCNVLDNPAIREGVKKFSDWPTIPQLYVDGEFIGGADVTRQMFESGDLQELLKPEGEDKN